jgi:acetylornithine deacetylase/succinyl-diaminopimelate desuccinylase-like protein
MLKELEAVFARNEERYVDEWKRLVGFPSVSAQPEHEQDCRCCAEWLVEHIGAMGFEARLLETPSLPCVFAAREGNPEKPALLFYGHYDVQPVDPLDQWITPPFEPSVRDGRLYGRGTADNKGQHLYVLKAIETLIELGKLEAPVKIILEGEEECGSRGTQCALESWKDLLSADLLMVTDTSTVDSGAPTIVMGLRGVLQLTLRVTGPTHDLHSGIHGGRAPNPVQGIAEMVAGLHGPDGAIAVADFYRGVREPSPDERRLANAVPFSGEAYAAATGVPAVAGEQAFTPQERVGFRPSIDINGIHGGYGGAGMKTIIPAEATAKITARLAAGQDPEFCLDALVRHLEQCVPEGLSAAIEDKGTAGPGLRLDLESEAVTRAKQALGRLTDEPIAYLWEGASIPIIPALAAASGAEPMPVGFGHAEDRVHAPNESFSLEQFRRGYLYAGLVLADL